MISEMRRVDPARGGWSRTENRHEAIAIAAFMKSSWDVETRATGLPARDLRADPNSGPK
jgi:hypothetical protein